MEITSMAEYNATLAIRGAITEASKEKLYQELGFQSLRIGDG